MKAYIRYNFNKTLLFQLYVGSYRRYANEMLFLTAKSPDLR